VTNRAFSWTEVIGFLADGELIVAVDNRHQFLLDAPEINNVIKVILLWDVNQGL